MGYSRKKLLPQKGTGKARSGDRGSPIRHDGGRAMARSAPNDFTSDLPKKVYARAVRIALSDKYRKGELFIIEQHLDLPETDDEAAMALFLKKHGLRNNKISFITNEYAENLIKATDNYADNIDVIQKEGVEVRDLLHPHKIFIDLASLEWLSAEYDQY